MRRAHSPLQVAAAILLLGLATACRTEPSRTTPGPGSPLISETTALTEPARERIRDYLVWVQAEYDIDYRVVVRALGPDASITEAAAGQFESAVVGGRHGGRGLLLWIDPEGGAVRVEVGYALEPFLTDLAASRMIYDYLAPWFGSGELGPAIEASVEALVDRIAADLEEMQAMPALTKGSGGGGASIDLLRDLPAGELTARDENALRKALVPQPDPRAARDLELAMLHRGIYFQQASLYDSAWNVARRPGHWSPERLREIARQWDRPYEVAIDDDAAVAYYADAPALGPTLLYRDEDGWRIDATAGARLVVYDYSNDGWYLIDEPGPYLELLRSVFELRRVQLGDGRSAWMLADRG